MSARAVNDIDLLLLGLRAVLRLRRGRKAWCYGRARGERTSWMRWRVPLGGARWARRPRAEGDNALSWNTVEPEQHLVRDISYIPMLIKHKWQRLVWNPSMQCTIFFFWPQFVFEPETMKHWTLIPRSTAAQWLCTKGKECGCSRWMAYVLVSRTRCGSLPTCYDLQNTHDDTFISFDSYTEKCRNEHKLFRGG